MQHNVDKNISVRGKLQKLTDEQKTMLGTIAVAMVSHSGDKFLTEIKTFMKNYKLALKNPINRPKTAPPPTKRVSSPPMVDSNSRKAKKKLHHEDSLHCDPEIITLGSGKERRKHTDQKWKKLSDNLQNVYTTSEECKTTQKDGDKLYEALQIKMKNENREKRKKYKKDKQNLSEDIDIMN
jgi:hypothetical protein